MIPKSMASDLIRGWHPVFGKDHAQTNISADFAVLKRQRML
jgi:hypothetical protein